MTDPLSKAAIAIPSVVILGVILVVAEVAETFKDTPKHAILNRWCLLLGLVNAVLSAGVLLVLVSMAGAAYSAGTVLGVGFGLPVLIRTKFTVLKGLAAGGISEGIGVDIGALYGALQRVCKRRIDVIVAVYLLRVARELAGVAPSLDALLAEARTALASLTTLSQAERAQHDSYLTTIEQDVSSSDKERRELVGMLIFRLGGMPLVREVRARLHI